MPKRWLVKRRLLCERLDIWAAAIREVLVCSTKQTNIGKILVLKFIRVKYFHTFSVYGNIFTTKTNELQYFTDAELFFNMTVNSTVCDYSHYINSTLQEWGKYIGMLD